MPRVRALPTDANFCFRARLGYSAPLGLCEHLLGVEDSDPKLALTGPGVCGRKQWRIAVRTAGGKKMKRLLRAWSGIQSATDRPHYCLRFLLLAIGTEWARRCGKRIVVLRLLAST